MAVEPGRVLDGGRVPQSSPTPGTGASLERGQCQGGRKAPAQSFWLCGYQELNSVMSNFQQPSLFKKVLAEFVGTSAMVFAGCGAIVVNAKSDGAVTHVGIATVFGLIVMTMIYAVGHISGAHFNPAVTLAFAMLGRFSWREVPGYILSQVTAATFASAGVRFVLGNVRKLGATLPSETALQSLVLEIILTFILMFVIAAVATDSRAEGSMAGIAIGATVALDALFGGPVSGASMNPARSIGPALVSQEFDHLWVYVVGPVIGAWLGAITYNAIRCEAASDDKGPYGCCK